MNGTDDQISLIPEPEPEAVEEEEVVRLPWDGEVVDFSEAMLARGHAYGSYVNTSRAIPDVRDGLKPVQRRILFAMQELGIRSDRPFRKSSVTVGHVIGNYHPHGDSAVYDAMVRLAQDFQSTTPLVDGQGNWGNVDGDPAAATRYTEARLTAIATESMADLRPEVVPYRDNFTEERQEAVVLPVVAPLLLTLGQSGIGWSMASDIPPHALGEVLDACIVVAKKPKASLEDIMRVLPGPDFPGGGVIVNTDGLAAIYRTGQGTIQLQGRYVIEALPSNQQALLITDLPYQVGPDQIVKQVVQAARDGKITEVVETPRNLSGRTTGLRVQIKVKRGGNVQKLIADLLRYTKLRDTVKFNFTVLVDGKPRVVSLVEILQRFVAFRHEIVSKRLAYERSVLQRDLHRLLALMAALGAIDEVVAIIRGAEDDDDAKAKLMAALTYVPHGQKGALPIDEQQATWIIEMQLRRLNRLNRFRLQDEVRVKGERIDEIGATLESEHGVRDIVVTELKATKTAHAVPRKTTLAGAAAPTLSAPDGETPGVSEGGPVSIYVSDTGQVLTADPHVRRIPRLPLQPAAAASVVAIHDLLANGPLIAISSGGLAFSMSPMDGPPETRRGRGVQGISPTRGDRIVAVLRGDEGATHAALVTAEGQLKRVEWSIFAGVHAAGFGVIRVEGTDRVVACIPHGDDDEILIATAGGQLLRAALGPIRAVQSGAAGGVAGMRIATGDRVVSAMVAGGDVVTIHATGLGKRTGLDDYPAKGRGTGGVQNASVDRPTKEPAGEVAVVACVPPGRRFLMVTARGESVEIRADDLPLVARAAVSRPLVPIAEGDRPALVHPHTVSVAGGGG